MDIIAEAGFSTSVDSSGLLFTPSGIAKTAGLVNVGRTDDGAHE